MRSFFQTANVTALMLMLTGVKSQWTLNLLSSDTYPLARCLDGTQGGYYISPGSGADVAPSALSVFEVETGISSPSTFRLENKEDSTA
jgi:hypothetical protein